MSKFSRCNISIPNRSHGFTAEEASQMSVEDFDKLCLEDQIFVYNNYPNEYRRLTGRPYEETTDSTTAPQDEDERKARDFATEFEKRIDRAFVNVTGHKCGEIPENP